MDFRILGPIEVRRDGEALDLGPPKQRMLLADLVLSAPRVVRTDRLLDDLWGVDTSPRESALWAYVSRLRGVLEPDREPRAEATVLVTRGDGYALDVDPCAVDAHRFEEAVARGRALLHDDPSTASEVLAGALDLWRGRPLGEFADEPFARAEVTRLEGLRLAALEDRIGADLRRGAAGRLVGELEALVATEPLHERFVGLLMLALYRSGRQADALRAYERFRRRLGDELGLDPSPELRRLEEQVLLHDGRIRSPDGDEHRRMTPGANPFKGLQPFDECDEPVFFGRESLVADVLRRIDGGARFVALVGASGSGKSSVLRAGVVPALLARGREREDGGGWLVARIAPGAHPFAELAAALRRVAAEPSGDAALQLEESTAGVRRATRRVLPDDGSRLLLVVDQLEELFTLADGDERDRFLSALVGVVDDPDDRVVLLVALRADLYARPLAHAEFGARLGDAVVNVVPLRPDELEAAATEPAARAGVLLEPALLATLVGDVAGQPGALPLFQYTLTELFERRDGDTLTLDAYRAVGGVRGALRARAEQLFGDLDDDHRTAARQLFLRLVAVEVGGAWGRRRVTAAEVGALDVDKVAVQEVVRAFAGARLLTLDRDPRLDVPTVEVAHEALLTEWDRLRGWVDEAARDLRRHASLRAAIADWEASGRDPSYLLTGGRLEDYASWAATATMRLTTEEQAFVDSSTAAADDRAAAERERVAEERRLVRAARRRLRALVGLLVLVVGSAAVAVGVLLAPGPPRIGLISSGLESAASDQVVAGLEQAGRDHDVRTEVVRPLTDPLAEVLAFLRGDFDLVIVDTLVEPDLQVPIAPLLESFPDVQFVLIGTAGGFDPASVTAPNAVSVDFATEQGSFLAGAAAALESRTGVVGYVGGPPHLVDEFRAGFEAGARHVDPDVTVVSATTLPGGVDAFGAAGPVQAAASRLYEEGADVVMHAAGPAGAGVHRAAVAWSERTGRHRWSIGVDADEWVGVPPAQRPHVLTSMLKRHDVATRLAVAAHLDGTLGDLTMTPANGGLALARSGDHLTTATTDRVSSLTDDLGSGRIVVPTFVSTPPTSTEDPDLRASLTVDDGACTGDLPADTTLPVGQVVSVGADNPTTTPVALEVWRLRRPSTLAALRAAGDLTSSVDGGSPWTAALVAPGGAHAVSFRPPAAGAWVVGCRPLDGDGPVPVGVVVAERVTQPVTVEATVTATDAACTWDGPSSLALGDVVRITATDRTAIGTSVDVATFVDGSDPTAIAAAPAALATWLAAESRVPPDSTVELVVHVARPGTWSVGCRTGDEPTSTPVLVTEVQPPDGR